MAWSGDEIVQVVCGALGEANRAADAAQDVRGIDALDEVGLHPILARGFERRGWGVFREWPYPGAAGGRPARAERERCDLVLTPHAGWPPRDPVAEEARAREAEAATLFASVASRAGSAGCAPESCGWIEVKTMGQHVYRRGVPGPNGSYASELTAAFAGDLRKLAGETRAAHAFVVVVLFAAARDVVEHDVPVALHRAIDRGLEFDGPWLGGFPIVDRGGNAWCGVGAVRVRRG